ncbi:MAG: nucleoside 2-deoxyribosyltransferase [Nanoarchaeota archaeon]|nr:nucleoside 2-deoxyribosyltransferase [Nanoarchaeota archaeon]
MKNAYLAIKFHEKNKNKELIENVSKALLGAEIQTTVMARDYEKWGEIHFLPEELMKLTFELIDKSEMLIIEFSEKGVGLGIEAGYAFSKKIPIIVIAKEGSDISNTLKGISKQIIYYKNPGELAGIFKNITL